MPQLLEFAPYDHPVLRKKTQPVKFPLSMEDLQIIGDMIFSIQKEQLASVHTDFTSAAGMAANQWGIDRSIFLFCPEGNETGKIEVIINPSYEILDTKQDEGWEGCFSIPNSSGRVKRYLRVKVKYQNQAGDKIEKELDGWYARVFQHETDHLNGILFDDNKAAKCLEKVHFHNEEELEHFFNRIRKERRET